MEGTFDGCNEDGMYPTYARTPSFLRCSHPQLPLPIGMAESRTHFRNLSRESPPMELPDLYRSWIPQQACSRPRSHQTSAFASMDAQQDYGLLKESFTGSSGSSAAMLNSPAGGGVCNGIAEADRPHRKGPPRVVGCGINESCWNGMSYSDSSTEIPFKLRKSHSEGAGLDSVGNWDKVERKRSLHSSQSQLDLGINPDFAMIYALLGSLFDPECEGINHSSLLQQMNALDRETTLVLLQTCSHNLRRPVRTSFLEQLRWTAGFDYLPAVHPGTRHM